jgi:hypothetical protein
MELKNKTTYIQSVVDKLFNYENQGQNLTNNNNINLSSSFALSEKKYSN